MPDDQTSPEDDRYHEEVKARLDFFSPDNTVKKERARQRVIRFFRRRGYLSKKKGPLRDPLPEERDANDDNPGAASRKR